MSTIEALPYICTLQRNTEKVMSCSYLLPFVYTACQTPGIVIFLKKKNNSQAFERTDDRHETLIALKLMQKLPLTFAVRILHQKCGYN